MEVVFVESGEFTKRVVKLGLEEDLRELQNQLVDNPRLGVLDPGTCGLRKIRMRDRTRRQGKSFGVRVHYLYVQHRRTIYLLNIYAKDEQDSLTPDQKKKLCAIIRLLDAQ
ncbi:MAG TPA: hypothetical protein VFR81_27005 [Longimicrobium sp.]|nr:hypothetical protein [Longimicrobium sp.]